MCLYRLHVSRSMQQASQKLLGADENPLLEVVALHDIRATGGGAEPVSDENRVSMESTLRQIINSGVWVVAAFAIDAEALDLWKAAYDMGMIAQHWAWFGGDGIQGGMLAGDVANVKYFVGSIGIQGQRLLVLGAKIGWRFPRLRSPGEERCPPRLRGDVEGRYAYHRATRV